MFLLTLEVECYGCLYESPEGVLVDAISFGNVDRTPGIPLKTCVEQMFRILQRSSLRERQLDFVLVDLSGTDKTVMRPCGSPPPLPPFNDFRIGLFYELAYFAERSPAPVVQFLDPLTRSTRMQIHFVGLRPSS